MDGRKGLVRCMHCWAYMNPYCRFTQGGRFFLCNLCGAENETPSWYYATTDSAGNRFDRAERPELSRGGIDILAGKEFYGAIPHFCVRGGRDAEVAGIGGIFGDSFIDRGMCGELAGRWARTNWNLCGGHECAHADRFRGNMAGVSSRKVTCVKWS